jgi:hypothetical protein
MKHTLLTLLAFLFCTITLSAQHCAVDSITIPVQPASGPGLTPLPEDLPCMVVDSLVSDTIYFQNFDYAYIGSSAIYVDSLKIDSVNNLPAGLCWVADRSDNTYPNSGNGVIYVEGTCNAAPGQYKLKIIVDAQMPKRWQGSGIMSGSGATVIHARMSIQSMESPCHSYHITTARDRL